MFRGSDDATTLPFLIPSNAMMAVELERLNETVLWLLPLWKIWLLLLVVMA
jgi:meiotically up-regulated gene 157 (Mug157) protein